MSTIITDGQSLADVAVQTYGSFEALFDLADAAGLGITDTLTGGLALATPASVAMVPTVATAFTSRAQRVNTGGGLVADTVLAALLDFTRADFSTSDFH